MSAITPKNGVSIARILDPELIFIDPPQRERESLLEFLIGRLCAVKSIPDPAAFLKKLLEREQGIDTTLDTGLSLPHARVSGLADMAAVLCLLHDSLTDPQQPEVPIRAMFLFFSPDSPEWSSRHLQFLRAIAMLFQPEFLDRLLRSAAPNDVLALIRRQESAGGGARPLGGGAQPLG